MNDLIDLRIIEGEGDLVRLEFFRGEERLLWINLTRKQALDWGIKISAAGMKEASPHEAVPGR